MIAGRQKSLKKFFRRMGPRGAKDESQRLILRAGALWLLVGLVMGIWIGVSEKLQYQPVHAHINLVG